MATALESFGAAFVNNWATHVRTQRTVGHDVFVGPHAAWHGAAHADGYAGRRGIGVTEGHRLVDRHTRRLAHCAFRIRQYGAARIHCGGGLRGVDRDHD